ncbi:MAG: hypothetical protein ABFD94_07265, partial [Armatimonadia bacterium]
MTVILDRSNPDGWAYGSLEAMLGKWKTAQARGQSYQPHIWVGKRDTKSDLIVGRPIILYQTGSQPHKGSQGFKALGAIVGEAERDSEGQHRIQIDIVQPFSVSVPYHVVSRDPVLRNTRFCRYPRGTNYLLDDAQTMRVAQVLSLQLPQLEGEILRHHLGCPTTPDEWLEQEDTSPQKHTVTTEQILRNRALVDTVKRESGCPCELCATGSFRTRAGAAYCEAHHIIPLGDGGWDIRAN